MEPTETLTYLETYSPVWVLEVLAIAEAIGAEAN